MNFTLACEREDDGRWPARKCWPLRVIADRLEHGEVKAFDIRTSLPAAARAYGLRRRPCEFSPLCKTSAGKSFGKPARTKHWRERFTSILLSPFTMAMRSARRCWPESPSTLGSSLPIFWREIGDLTPRFVTPARGAFSSSGDNPSPSCGAQTRWFHGPCATDINHRLAEKNQ